MSDPRVSLVLPSRNGAAHLDEAIASVAAQTWKRWELRLVDDGSDDETGAIMDAWARRDERIHVLHLTPNRGLPAALNEGFRHARGELFGWTSDDNCFLPNALERLAGRLAESDAADVVYADYVCVDPSGRERRAHVGSPRGLLVRNVVGSCFLYRREVHEELGGFDTRLFLAEDYDFWLRASRRFRFDAIPEVLYRVRLHGDSLTSRHPGRVRRAVADALERQLAAAGPPERAHALLVRAGQLFHAREPRAARRLVRLAIREAPGEALRGEHRRTLWAFLFGWRGAGRLCAPWSHPPAIRGLAPREPDEVAGWYRELAAARPADAAPVELAWLDDAVGPAPRPRSGPGTWIASDARSLAWAARVGREAAIVQLLHRTEDCALAVSLAPWVDLILAPEARLREELRERLPDRAADIRPAEDPVAVHALLADLMARPLPWRPPGPPGR